MFGRPFVHKVLLAVLPRLFLLFIVLPLIELVLLLQLAKWIDWWGTILVVVITGAIGISLARAQGFRTYRRIQAELAEGRMPADSLLDAMMILVAGALLLTPGVLTDAFGLSLLVPSCRRWYRVWLVRRFTGRFRVYQRGAPPPGFGAGHSEVIDSYVVPTDDEEDHGSRGS